MVQLDDPITIYAGETFFRQFGYATKASAASTAARVDLTGCVLKLQVRERIGAAAVLLELSTANGGIVLTDAANGYYALGLDAADTAAMAWSKGIGDLEITFADGTVRRVWRAKFVVSPEVTL